MFDDLSLLMAFALLMVTMSCVFSWIFHNLEERKISKKVSEKND